MTYPAARTVPRFPLPREKMKFVFDEGEKVFAVRDISARGLGISLLEFGDSLYFPLGYECGAELNIDDKPMLVKVRVARLNSWSVGFTFEELPAEQEARIRAFVDPLHIAASLRAVDPRGAPDAFEGISVWYHGDPASDLFLWNDPRGGLARALFANGNRYWEWEAGLGANTGSLEASGEVKVILKRDAQPDPSQAALTRKVLEHAEGLDYRLVSFLKEKT